MSKTPKAFKSSLMGKESRLVIEPSKVLASESFYITQETVLGGKSFNFHNAQAPAIALAILEAAGVKDTSTGGLITHDRVAVTNLQIHIEKQERAAAEAEAQAELEAEALELYNVCMTGHSLSSFNGLGGTLRDQWLAVARRAREINKEDTK